MPRFSLSKVAALGSSLLLFGGYVYHRSGGDVAALVGGTNATTAVDPSAAPVMLPGSKSYGGLTVVTSGTLTVKEEPDETLLPGSKTGVMTIWTTSAPAVDSTVGPPFELSSTPEIKAVNGLDVLGIQHSTIDPFATPPLQPSAANSVSLFPGSKSVVLTEGFHQIQGIPSNETLALAVGDRRVLTFGEPVPQAQIANPEIVELTAVSATQILVYAKRPGTTRITFWDVKQKRDFVVTVAAAVANGSTSVPLERPTAEQTPPVLLPGSKVPASLFPPQTMNGKPPVANAPGSLQQSAPTHQQASPAQNKPY